MTLVPDIADLLRADRLAAVVEAADDLIDAAVHLRRAARDGNDEAIARWLEVIEFGVEVATYAARG